MAQGYRRLFNGFLCLPLRGEIVFATTGISTVRLSRLLYLDDLFFLRGASALMLWTVLLGTEVVMFWQSGKTSGVVLRRSNLQREWKRR